MPQPRKGEPVDPSLKTQVYEFRCSRSLIEAADAAARRAGMDRSEWSRMVILLASGKLAPINEVAKTWGIYHSRRRRRNTRT